MKSDSVIGKIEQFTHGAPVGCSDGGTVIVDDRYYKDKIATLESQLAALQRENEELRRDAERYRWLRSNWWVDETEKPTVSPVIMAKTANQFDAAIDAALRRPAEEQEGEG